MALTAKQRRFVEEYLVDANATQAAIRAGYSPRTAGSIGQENLTKPEIASALEKAQAERAARVQVTADEVLAELKKLGFSNMLDYATIQPDGTAYVDLSSLTREQAAAIQEMTVDEYTEGRGEDARPVKKVRVKLVDKKGTLELLGQHLGLFKPVAAETPGKKEQRQQEAEKTAAGGRYPVQKAPRLAVDNTG